MKMSKVLKAGLIGFISVWFVIYTWTFCFSATKTPKGIYSTLASSMPVESLLGNQYVKGISIRTSWDSIESIEGTFDWSCIDNLISQAKKAGKKISITIMPGVNTPEWVYVKGAEKFYFIDKNPYHPTYGQLLYCPMPWDAVYLTSWKHFIETLAVRYGKNPAVSWVRITGPMNTTTMDWGILEKEWDDCSKQKITVAIKSVIDSFANSFYPKSLSIAIAGGAKTMVTEVVNYGFMNYPRQFNIQINSWRAAMPPTEEQNPIMDLFEQYSPNTGAQMVWSATNDPDCRMNGRIKPCDPYTSLDRAIDAAIIYNLSFLEIYAVDIMNPDLQGVLKKYNDFIRRRK